MIVIGLMSGTSADGVDIALCEITGQPPKVEATILDATMIPYDAVMRDRILQAVQAETGRVDKIGQLNFDLAAHFADAIQQHKYHADLIASHGQTVWHNVDESGKVTSTLQIGSGAVLAEKTGITVINNFRERDVAAGGQGAPLTAYVDYLLLRHETKWRAIQNIGGMGNVTLVPPLSDTTSELIAFDTGAGNALIDATVLHITDGQLAYDKDGQIANAGQAVGAWLEDLLDQPYYHRKPPKTTGRELFGTEMAVKLVLEGQLQGYSNNDIVATLTALTATSIAQAYRDFVAHNIGEIIIGGGGASNPTLMQMIQNLVQPIPVLTHEDIGLSSDYKEALVFAVLAYETWHNRSSTLPSQTGASHSSILGQITPGLNYADLIYKTWCL
ncbi:MAG: anhydro-N-acetylmuramic acid kinase [Anaerolineae bacterium]|nr:anhydro-N-acetylmuramic acid kinase [Anaerolineae bacterium]MDQ7034869.1 anhydro-N-acetylmuramic acid kinase [Anaerolineae bacterium]